MSDNRNGGRRRSWIGAALLVPWSAACFLCSVWAVGALHYDGPLGRGTGNWALVGAWIMLVIALLIVVKGAWRRSLAWAACFLVVLLPWLAIRPSNDRPWQAEWAETGWVEIDGDAYTFHNFRNFDYGPDGTMIERWETRTVRLSNLRGLDLFLDAFGGECLAHPVFSFDFGPDGYVALSVETRREVGESFSELGGLYKMFELQYLFGDERDLIRLRTNVRKNPVYLYRIDSSDERIVEGFLESVEAANALQREPRFYHLIRANCTTALRAQRPAQKRDPFDIRILINGKLDELLYEIGVLHRAGLSFPDLREAALINDVAIEAHDDPAFSRRVRERRPGFGGRGSTEARDGTMARALDSSHEEAGS